MVIRYLIVLFGLCISNLALAQIANCPVGAKYWINEGASFCLAGVCQSVCDAPDGKCVGVGVGGGSVQFRVVTTGEKCGSGSGSDGSGSEDSSSSNIIDDYKMDASLIMNPGLIDPVIDKHEFCFRTPDGKSSRCTKVPTGVDISRAIETVWRDTRIVNRDLFTFTNTVKRAFNKTDNSLNQNSQDILDLKMTVSAVQNEVPKLFALESEKIDNFMTNAKYELDARQSDFAEVFTSQLSDIASVAYSAPDRAELYDGLSGIRSELYPEIYRESGSVRDELYSETSNLRDELYTETASLSNQISASSLANAEGLDGINSKLDNLNDKHDAQVISDSVNQSDVTVRLAGLDESMFSTSEQLSLLRSDIAALSESVDTGIGSGGGSGGNGSSFDDTGIIGAIDSQTGDITASIASLESNFSEVESFEFPGEPSSLPEQIVDFSDFEKYIKTDYLSGGSGSCPSDYTIAVPGFA
uniref:hypothetical protein n=1 Tax=Oceanimonas smirnovii TaxID=264574 RepID=UPI001B7FBB8A